MTSQNTPALPFSLHAGLDELLEQAESKYPVHFEQVTIGDTPFSLLQIKDMEAYIEHLASTAAPDQGLTLPFWAKIWPTSLLLGHLLHSSLPVAGKEHLEIGAGVGLCGLVAASRGARVTMTDGNDDALLFAWINVLKNGLQDRVDIARIDFTTDRMGRRFQRIIGSEVLYRESSYPGLLDFLLAHLADTPDAEIILAKSQKFKAAQFLQMASERFAMQQRSLGYTEKSPQSGEPERHVCHILRLTSRDHA